MKKGIILAMLIGLMIPALAGAAIDDIRVSNNTSAAVVISWVTDSDTPGEVHYSAYPDLSNPITAYDVRGQAFLGCTHYVDIKNLQKEKTFYFEVASGSESDDNGGSYYTFKTMKEPSSPPGICMLYGHVYHEDGTTPAQGALVYLRITHGGVNSYLLSKLIDPQRQGKASFAINIKEARSVTTDNLFSSFNSGDPIHLEAIYCGGSATSSDLAYTGCMRNCGSFRLSYIYSSTTTTLSTSSTTVPDTITTTIPSPTTIPLPPPPPQQKTTTTTTIGAGTTTSSIRSTTTTAKSTTTSSATSSVVTTSTSITSTTTTTTIPSLWPLAYEEMWGINKEKNLSLLRSFRDREIASNRLGQEYLRLLYSNSTEIATLLLHNPRLGKEVRKVINELLPDLRSLLSGKKVSVSKKKVTHLESLLKKFEKRGSPQLKAAVKKVRKDLRKGVLFKQFGITIDERRVGG